jgi:putative (di)nucleoside polyphosphate hydrolase
MTEVNQLPYRPCVGMMLLNSKGKVFVAKRIDTISEAWQMPQGGVDKGEDTYQAALRELREETSVTDVKLLAQTDDWLSYDLSEHLVPKLWDGKYRGQVQKWYVFRLLGDDASIDIQTNEPEFSEWKWVDIQELPDLIVPFKRELYQTLADRFRYLTQ